MKQCSLTLALIVLCLSFFKVDLSAKSDFEGSLLYVSYEHHSDAVLKYSYGMAYNGTKNVKIMMKGSAIHIVDLCTHMHEIIDMEFQKYLVYSDLTNEGVDCGISYLNTIKSTLSEQSQYYNYNYQQTGTIKYKGDLCKKMKSNISSKDPSSNASGSVEIWYSNKISSNTAYQYFAFGAPVSGIIKKWLYISNAKSMVGDMRSMVSTELVAINPESLDDDIFSFPNNIKVLKKDPVTAVPSLYKNNKKAMKKIGIIPADENMEARLKIENDWDYVKQWEQAIGEPSKAKPLLDYKEWAKIGVGLFTNITQLLRTQPEQDEETLVQSEESGHAHESTTRHSKSHDKKIKCKQCNGSGKCSSMNVRVSVKYYCGGTKRCKYCSGTGTITHLGQEITCTACNGNKLCKYCNGSGRCSRCNGSKYE